MVFSICKEVLPYYANLPAIPDSSEVMTKEELACWFYLFAQSNQLGQGTVTLKNIAEAFGYSSTSANTPKIITPIRDALIGMVQKAKGETSAEFEMNIDEVKVAKPTHEIKYVVKDYQEVRQAPFIRVCPQDLEGLFKDKAAGSSQRIHGHSWKFDYAEERCWLLAVGCIHHEHLWRVRGHLPEVSQGAGSSGAYLR